VRERAATWTLDWVGHLPGKRESRRFEGDHILSEADVLIGLDGVPHDVIAHGGWPIDLHAEDGIYSPDRPCTQPPLPGLYGIPLRSIYSRTVSNLLLAGRDISTTHVAHGTTRVMKTCAVIGEAAGNVAAHILQSGQTLRELANDPCGVEALQQTLLRDGMYLPLRTGKYDNDLARRPDVSTTASSEATLRLGAGMRWEEAGLSVPEHSGLVAAAQEELRWMPLDRTLGQAFVMSGERLESVSLQLSSTAGASVTVRMQVRQARQLRDFGQLEAGADTLATVEGTVHPGNSTITFGFDEALVCQPHHPIVLMLEPAAGVSWAISLQEPPGTQAGVWDEQLGYWRWIHGSLVFDADPTSAPYQAENILTGVTRPERGTNMWVSDPSQAMPQWITLAWDEPVDIGRIELTFDSQLSGWIWEGPFPNVVRDYDIEVSVGNQRRVALSVLGNYQRRRFHDVEERQVDAITLVVRDTNGAATARVSEIRVYPPTGSGSGSS
jgi:hypothetical protein